MFYVFRCKNCGSWESRDVRNIQTYKFKCFGCGKTTKIRQEKKEGIAIENYGPYGSAKEAELMCKQVKMRQGEEYDKQKGGSTIKI